MIFTGNETHSILTPFSTQKELDGDGCGTGTGDGLSK